VDGGLDPGADLLTNLGLGRHEPRRDGRLRHGVTSFRPERAVSGLLPGGYAIFIFHGTRDGSPARA
jgi:hypothetical protein